MKDMELCRFKSFQFFDHSLTWNVALETGGILVGDEVTITLDVEFIKA